MNKLTAYKLVIYREGEVVRDINGYAGGENEWEDMHRQFGKILTEEAEYSKWITDIRKTIKC